MKQQLQSLNNYLWNTGNTVSEMRLLIEGAVVLFEEDALPLTKLAHANSKHQAAVAFDAIGAALYNLRKYICELQQEHTAEVNRQRLGKKARKGRQVIYQLNC